MLPLSHIAYTWLAASLAQEVLPLPTDEPIDFRLLAVAATAPDLVDKPLAAVYFYPRYKAAVLFAHTLLATLAVVAWSARAVQRGRSKLLWVYTAAVVGHSLLDRIWHYRDTFYWPFRGWRFHVWGKQGSEQTQMGRAYWFAFTRRPELWGWELGGLLALALVIWRHGLWKGDRLRALIRTGRLERR